MRIVQTIKTYAITAFAPVLLNSLKTDAQDFYRMLWNAMQLSRQKQSPEQFRGTLDAFYSNVRLDTLRRDLNFESIRQQLRVPNGYKVRVLNFGTSTTGGSPTKGPPSRRLRLLARLGVQSDIIILRRNESIPPHGHIGVVSGFLVLEGEVRIRHFHWIDQRETGLDLRPTIDAVLRHGEYTTNSEFCDDVHWLQGIAEESFLFRTNVTGVKASRWEGVRESNDRLYVDPTGELDANGHVFAPFVSGAVAKELRMQP